MLALADENENGAISWREFIPVGIEAIKTFLARNKLLQKMPPAKVEINEETMRYVFMEEVQMVSSMIVRELQDIDCDEETKEHSGKIKFDDIKKVLLGTCHLCIKEVNLLLRTYVLKYGYDDINYTDFEEDLFQIRFDFLRSRLMDINVMNWSDDFFLECGRPLVDGCRMTVQDARQALSDSKLLTLHSLQITNLVGHAKMEANQTIDVAALGKELKSLIESQYLVEAMRRKA